MWLDLLCLLYEPNFRRTVRVWMNVNMKKSFPRFVNGDATEAGLGVTTRVRGSYVGAKVIAVGVGGGATVAVVTPPPGDAHPVTRRAARRVTIPRMKHVFTVSPPHAVYEATGALARHEQRIVIRDAVSAVGNTGAQVTDAHEDDAADHNEPERNALTDTFRQFHASSLQRCLPDAANEQTMHPHRSPCCSHYRNCLHRAFFLGGSVVERTSGVRCKFRVALVMRR